MRLGTQYRPINEPGEDDNGDKESRLLSLALTNGFDDGCVVMTTMSTIE